MKLYQEQELKIYNSLSNSKETFKSITDGYVGMYVCGPTVYSDVHLGNCRTFISFDLVYRYLKHLEYKVRYVRNITDVGHLVNDADEGEDKIAKKARLEALEPMEIVQRYTKGFHDVLSQFNNLDPSIEPTATGHIIEQIEIIQNIIDQGYAYIVDGSVYFDVLKFNEDNQYGILSGRKVDEAIHNTRDLSGQTEKKNPQDFALWKKAEPQHIMRWPSPWSDGFPGWHLECTAMSTKYLGDKFDIHGGGMDLKFPHHECEIAQNQAAKGQNPVNYWLHANMLTMNGKKMAKSTGNNILPNEIFTGDNTILSKDFSPSVVRFFMLQAHYRSILDLSSDALEASEKGYKKLMEAIKTLKGITAGPESSFNVSAWRKECYKAMNDDFNSPILIAHLFDAVKFINQIKDDTSSITAADLTLLSQTIDTFVFDILGLVDENQTGNNTDKLDGTVDLLIKMRAEAKANRDFSTADQIRDNLKALGIQLKDSREGTTYSID